MHMGSMSPDQPEFTISYSQHYSRPKSQASTPEAPRQVQVLSYALRVHCTRLAAALGTSCLRCWLGGGLPRDTACAISVSSFNASA